MFAFKMLIQVRPLDSVNKCHMRRFSPLYHPHPVGN
uniref:Uncharacterized protein n=1 Tax=Rhizophora mucronata TaxID=61149 RepID=A0A2P2R1F1_RHIMU